MASSSFHLSARKKKVGQILTFLIFMMQLLGKKLSQKSSRKKHPTTVQNSSKVKVKCRWKMGLCQAVLIPPWSHITWSLVNLIQVTVLVYYFFFWVLLLVAYSIHLFWSIWPSVSVCTAFDYYFHSHLMFIIFTMSKR